VLTVEQPAPRNPSKRLSLARRDLPETVDISPAGHSGQAKLVCFSDWRNRSNHA
jgi:hypothetical protein